MITFLKMHGLGNDFVVLDARRGDVSLDPDLIRRIGDRHRGIGFDQLVLLRPSQTADVEIRFYNPDGGEAGACGNASRCIAGLMAEATGRDRVTLETRAGRLPAERHPDGSITVQMTPPKLDWDAIPLRDPGDTNHVDLGIAGLPPAVCVSMGNPHAVFFVDDVDRIATQGPGLVHHPVFPDGANIGFATLEAPGRLRLRVFERGAGLTLACGSGACAAMVAAVRRGLVTDSATLILDGGELELAWPGEGPVAMTGPWAKSFTGKFDPASIGR
jgi:diaminopimelate epimerase